ncbi:MAG: NAD(+)/NADH kinase [Fimbriimonadaceae bacterium]|nr:NAD(+)/NADH kinase [Fimbriimonadaceae bacterium]
MRAHFIVNTYRPLAVEATRETVDWLRGIGVDVGVESEAADMVVAPRVEPGRLGEADLVICMGGDGTLIRAAHLVGATGTPLLGVNFGRFGFVCACPPARRHEAIDRFMKGEAEIAERLMLETQLVRDRKQVATLHVLNEAVVQRAATTRMLTFDVTVNQQLLAHYPADGVMVSTPTGSTAYNLSAGGPIVHPDVAAFILTAVMPHTLTARPMILNDSSEIAISIETRGDAVLSCDGHSRLTLLSGDTVMIRRSPRVTRLMRVAEDDFLYKVSDKFGWSRRGPFSEPEPEESC